MRLSSASAILVAITSLGVSFVASVGHAAGLNPPYFVIDPPLQVTDTKRVEVVEVFSYGCGHCAQFQPQVDAWRAKLDTTKVFFAYLPSPASGPDLVLARGFIAAQKLGVVEKTHSEIFNAIHVRGVRVSSLDDLTALYSQLGVPREQFTKTANDPTVTPQLRQILDLMIRYRVDSTPTLIVAGKYRITTDSAGDQAAMLKVADSLVAQELARSSETSRQAPKSGK